MAESMFIGMYPDEEAYTPEQNLANLIRFSQPTSRPIRNRILCRYHQQGRCRFGNDCWNIHIDPGHTITFSARGVGGDDDLSRLNRMRSRFVFPIIGTRVVHEIESDHEINNDETTNAWGNQENTNSETHCIEPNNHVSSIQHGSVATNPGTNPNTNAEKSKMNDVPCNQDVHNATNEPVQEQACSNPPNWVNAPEFVPKPRSYAEILKRNTEVGTMENEKAKSELCTYHETGDCPFPENCPYIHGDLCEICQKNVLHPHDEILRKTHTEQCVKELEQDMELSFAVQRSQDKSCGICMDVVLEKEPKSERRFGILEKCSHVFCLACIRKWRKSKNFDSSQLENSLDPVVTRACPECRIPSDFITPSQYWIDTEDEKKKLIDDYKVALSKKPCKYFKQGKGNCPFGGACFYLHAKPDGTRVDLPPPVRRPRQNQDGELDFMGRIYLWDFLELREENFIPPQDLNDYTYSMSESESDTSEEEGDNFFLSETF